MFEILITCPPAVSNIQILPHKLNIENSGWKIDTDFFLKKKIFKQFIGERAVCKEMCVHLH